MYGFLNSFFQNSWSQRFAKVRLTGKYNYKYLQYSHISGEKSPEFVKMIKDTEIILQTLPITLFLLYTKKSEFDSLLYTHFSCTLYTQTFLPSIWNLDTHPLEILSKKGRASLLIHSKDNSKVLPPFKTFNFSDIRYCVRLQVFLKIENALSKINKLWKSMLFVIYLG